MYPQSHFLFAFFISVILVKFGVLNYQTALIIAVFAVLVDLDHFILFALKKHDYSLKDAWNAHVGKRYEGKVFFHHKYGIIFMTFLTILLFFISTNWFWIIGISYYSHMFLDYFKLNIIHIRKKFITIKEAGFIEKINNFELFFDLFLSIGIFLLILF